MSFTPDLLDAMDVVNLSCEDLFIQKDAVEGDKVSTGVLYDERGTVLFILILKVQQMVSFFLA